MPSASGFKTFFDSHQRRTIEAAMARIIPTDDHPGATEAGTVDFLDRYLAGIDYVYAKPDGSGFESLSGRRTEAWQRRIDIMREKYLAGVSELDRRSHDLFSAPFADLPDEQRDRILRSMERPELDVEEHFESSQATAGFTPGETAMQQTSVEIDLNFFPLLCLHTRQGFYSDPIYGGNQGHVGWGLIGFDGPASLAETHSGQYSSLPYFAEESINWTGGTDHDS